MRRSYKLTDVFSFVRSLPVFLEIDSFVFFWFLAQRSKMLMPNIWRSLIFEKNHFRSKMPECQKHSPVWFLRTIFFCGRKCLKYAGNCRFLQIFIGLFPNISLFFHTETLFITIPTIKHGSIVNKTDLCSQNSLKMAKAAYFHRKIDISCISLAVLYNKEKSILFHEILHTEHIADFDFWEILPAENAGNMAENAVFADFHRIFS